jgi:multimeric flavodoxin WrbA
MKIAIFDGDPRGRGTPLDVELGALLEQAKARGDRCERLRLAELEIHPCVGCFQCWVKDPGRCRLRDDGGRLAAAVAGVDLLVFAAPMRMGFVTSLLKRAQDRVIPNVLPYVEVVEGECHHPVRYHGFDVALLVERGDATAEEIAATIQIYRRFAKNTRGQFAWSRVIEGDGIGLPTQATNAGKELGHALGVH